MFAQMAGSIGSALNAWFNKSKSPKAIPYKGVDLQNTQAEAVAGNLKNLPEIEALVSQSNKFQQGQAVSMMEQALPGWGKLRDRLMSTASNLLENPYSLPDEVSSNIRRLAAERGVSAGTRGEFNEFSLLRDYGINSLQYGASRIGQAQGLAGLLASTSPRVSPISPISMFVSPSEQAAEQRYTNTKEQEILQGQENARVATRNRNVDHFWNKLEASQRESGQAADEMFSIFMGGGFF